MHCDSKNHSFVLLRNMSSKRSFRISYLDENESRMKNDFHVEATFAYVYITVRLKSINFTAQVASDLFSLP